MEIIQHGKVHPTVKVFRCQYCGCIFRANDLEYQSYWGRDQLIYQCTCPECEDCALEILPIESEEQRNAE